MLLIFGNRRRDTIMNVVVFACSYCGVRAPQNVIKRRNQFTLFFLPLFALSTTYLNECTHCGGQTPLSAEQAKRSLTWSQDHQYTGRPSDE